MKPKIGLLIIATGRYKQLLPPLLRSAEALFFPGHSVTRFVFSDGQFAAPETFVLSIEHEKWPLVTLKRFHYFLRYAERLREMDYLYYIDADMRFVQVCGEEILPAGLAGLVGVEHPGYFREGFTTITRLVRFAQDRKWPPARLKNSELPFERNPASRAFIADSRHSIYYYGGFNGGTAQAFLEMSAELRDAVEEDLSAGIVAVWHDESHLNKYFFDHKPKWLPPSYSYPEHPECPQIAHLKPIIMALHKDHAYFRAD
jgi:hypothetical protein